MVREEFIIHRDAYARFCYLYNKYHDAKIESEVQSNGVAYYTVYTVTCEKAKEGE